MLWDITMFGTKKTKLIIDKEVWRPTGSKEDLGVTFRRSNQSRHIKISIGGDGDILVSAPLRTAKSLLRKVLLEKEVWIMRSLSQLRTTGKVRNKKDEEISYQRHKERARKLVEQKLVYWNQFYKYTYGRVSIRNQRTRWGSCSRKGNLNFHYKILFLPEELVDYLIVHELCHLRAFDHSQRFWSLVSKTIPDYQKRRRALKQSSL